MKLLAHLVKADLRRSLAPLSAWLILAIVTAIIPCIVPALAGGDLWLLSAFDPPVALVTIAYPLVLLVLAVQVVQTDPVVGSTAFWMTRPIPPRTLLASKLVLLGVAAVIVPVVIEIIRMAAHGVPWRVQVGVALGTALAHALLVSAVMFGAAVTATMSRFLLLVGVLLLSLAVVITALIVAGSRTASPTSYAGWSAIPDPTPGVIVSVLAVLGLGGALLAQYGWRSRVRTVIVAGVGIATSILASMVWPWPVLRPTEAAPSWAQGDGALLVSVEDADAIRSFNFAGLNRDSWIGVRGALKVEGIAPQFSARVGVAEASLRLGADTLTSLRELYPATIDSSGEALPQPTVVPRAALDVDRAAMWIAPQRDVPTLFFADETAFQRHAPGSGEYRGRVRIVLQRHRVEASMPLIVGHVYQRGAHRLVIDHLHNRQGAFSMQVHESRASSAFDRSLQPHYSYYLRNSRLREAVPGLPQPLATAANALRIMSVSLAMQDDAHGFTARELLLHFSVPSGPGGQSIVLDDAWISDAELLIVSTERAGTIERDLTIANFPLTLPTRAQF